MATGMGHHLPLNSNYPFVRTSISYYLQSSSKLYTTGKLHLKKLNDLSMPAGRYMAEEKAYKAGLSCLGVGVCAVCRSEA